MQFFKLLSCTSNVYMVIMLGIMNYMELWVGFNGLMLISSARKVQ
jgi:hypothetical protein